MNRIEIPLGAGPIIGRRAYIYEAIRPRLGHAWSRKLHRARRDNRLMWRRIFTGHISHIGASDLTVERVDQPGDGERGNG